ncbi:hypothetical protein HF680_04360 [Brevundimonas sp. WCHBH090558]|uniref:toprim domain-containing protein n=1 Tax=Brevundimonas huaxiensis TaxID=2725493 RepID=UPI00162638B1|nr:toprim domain-containing protein [Brevundimonas huaxiensis]MBC1181888.1 hypothetical protein [Brevundimonas huaxiensis]
MSLRGIVAALGGDLYHNGARANVPGPGHSGEDRSVSLWLTEGRVVAHSFGGSDWRAVMADLRRRGLVDAAGRPAGAPLSGAASVARPDTRVRRQTAERLWSQGVRIGPSGLAARHLQRRAVPWSIGVRDLLEHPAAPVSVYRTGGPTLRALMARISDPDGRTTGVELTYLDAAARQAVRLAVSRKTVGCVPPGAAVRLSVVGRRMLVAEGVVTTLSAVRGFDLPGWALLSAGNLAAWTPPPDVRSVVIAADRGLAGEAAARRLKHRLTALGLAVEMRLPPPGCGDWNDAIRTTAEREKEGRGGAPERRG